MMKKALVLVAVLTLVAILNGQAMGQATQPPAYRVTANKIWTEGGTSHFRGAVTIVIGEVSVRAEEADFNSATGETTLRGDVRMTVPRGK